LAPKRLWSENPLFQWIQMLGGLVLAATGYRAFLIPCDIAAGGFTGISQLINHFTGWSVGGISLVLNVPLFLLSIRQLGLRFGLKSLLGTVLLSFFIDHLPISPITREPMLAAIFGAVLVGFGIGLIVRGGATTGGSEMLGKLINRHLRIVSIGAVCLGVDALVITSSAFVFNVDRALMAMVSAYLLNRVLDVTLVGFNHSKAYYIISDHGQQIAQRILKEMNRGVTGLKGQGMFSGQDKTVLMCVISHLEALQLRRIVAQTDPSAFVIVTDVREALGEGFNPDL